MATNTTTETLVGVFSNRKNAQEAVEDLFNAGFGQENVGFVAKKKLEHVDDSAGASESGAAAGVAVGALGGAAIGAGIAAGVIPVIGPILAIGTLGTVLLNAAGGAAALGIAGALAGWGVGEEDARYYESEVGKGKYLVTVEASHRLTEAQTILQRHGGVARREWQAQAMHA